MSIAQIWKSCNNKNVKSVKINNVSVKKKMENKNGNISKKVVD